MKKLFIVMMLIGGMATVQSAGAQVNIHVNIGNQPQWGPHGYNQVRYYYLPEINAYYDVYNRTYVYQDRRSWVTARQLPRQFANINLYNTYKVVINTPNPWRDNSAHRNRYDRYRYDHTQVSIRDYASRDHRRDRGTYDRVNRNNDYAHDRGNNRHR